MLNRIRYRQAQGQRPRPSLMLVATRCAVVSALVALGLTAAPVVVSPVAAAPTDGIVTVRVVQEVNANGLVESTILEPPLIGVEVTFTDASGNAQTVTTDTYGLAVLDPAVSTLTGGKYRVDVTNPKPGIYYPGFAANGQSAAAAPVTSTDLSTSTNAKLSSNTEFVEVSDGQDAYVNTSFWYPPYYCQDNAAVCDAVQPWNAPPNATSADTERTLISAPYKLNQQDVPLATGAETGVLYGIAYDRDHERIFSAAYAKRGSAYGPGGPGAIYVTDLTSTTYPLAGTTSQFATVPNAGVDNHDMTTNQDYGFFDHVGKESLGDIDITNDNRYLFGVNMFDKTVFVYDLTDDSYLASYPIPNPGCDDDWRPMGAGVGLETSYIGGVCSGQTDQDMSKLSAHVYEFDPATGVFGTQVVDQSLTYNRGRGYKGAYCDGSIEGDGVGRWYSWVDSFPQGPNEQRARGCDNANGEGGRIGWMAYPTPLLGDIVEETNGDLVIAFRDRYADQAGFNAQEPNLGGVFRASGETGAGGDIVRGCKLTDGTFVLDGNFDEISQTLAPGAVCTDNNAPGSGNNSGGQPNTYREFYTGDWRTGFHEEAFYGGIALSRVEPNIVSSGYDSTGEVWTQGISAVNRNGDLPTGSLGVRTDDNTVDQFGKGSGLADLEVLCDQAPLQIGNRVWLDANNDGIQGADEEPVGSVTVHLYDGDGNLVGTTTTTANGTYLFDDSNVTGGLAPNTQYTIKIDEPEDFDIGGPLNQHVPTLADAGGDDSLDSDGVAPPGSSYPETTLTTGGPGENDHTVDFGFVLQDPAVDIEKYDTTAGAMDGDADTAADAIGYQPGESRTIQLDVTNSGNMDLADVTITDRTISGGTVTDMFCDFPDGGSAGTLSDGTWTVGWAATLATPPTAVWAPGVTFSCTATLTLDGSAVPHADAATVDATAVETGASVTDRDDYHAFTGDVQLVKYDGRDGFAPSQDMNGIPQKPLVVGAERDANTAENAVDYVVAPAASTTGPHSVGWAVTNTGTTWLGAISISDQTLDGPDLTGISCDFSAVGGPASGTTWAGPWEPGSTFFCEGDLTLDAEGADATHGDLAAVASTVIRPEPNPDYDPTQPGSEPFTDQPALDDADAPVLSEVELSDDDPFYARTLVPAVSLVKGDGDSASHTIVNDANTMSDGQAYAPGETRAVILNLNNGGDTPVYNVTVTDALTAGDTAVQGLSCVFPGQSDPTAGTLVGTTWTVYWQETFDVAGGVAWEPDEAFSCTATLTLGDSAAPHVDTATVTTTMSPAGVPGDENNPPSAEPDGPTAQNAYSAYTGEIQVIKYDGNGADPAIGFAPTSWTPPVKPLSDLYQDANDAAHAVTYPADVAQSVSWVITNTGATWLANVTVVDTTDEGPDVGEWGCDLSGVGGPAEYSFTTSGPWAGPLAPGASFLCTGTLTLSANIVHADTVEVGGTVVQPLFDDDQPVVNNGVPAYATDIDGDPVLSDVVVADDDPFHAQTVSVTIFKGDGSGGSIVNDADTADTGAFYASGGETRTIVTVATNPSPASLRNVVMTDVTGAGSAPTGMFCDFPDGTSADGSYDAATKTWTVRWVATFAPGSTSWHPGDKILCNSTLTLDGLSGPHRDLAQVSAVTAGEDVVSGSNSYYAFSGGIQVIKYDGNSSDPDVGTSGAWTPPTKPLSDVDQDANDAAHAVGYALSSATGTGPQPVRWVVTNTGTTWLTDVVLSDVTDLEPSVAPSSIVCTFPDGSTAGVVDGAITWLNTAGVLFEPGASFFCQGMLTLGVADQHADHVDAVASIVPPATDGEGNPTDQPSLGPDDLPNRAINPATSEPWSVTDSDEFHATSPAAALAGTGADAVAILWPLLALLGGLLFLLMSRRRRSRGQTPSAS